MPQPTRRARGRLPLFFWIILALLALALGYRLVRPGTAHAHQPGVSATTVESGG